VIFELASARVNQTLRNSELGGLFTVLLMWRWLKLGDTRGKVTRTLAAVHSQRCVALLLSCLSQGKTGNLLCISEISVNIICSSQTLAFCDVLPVSQDENESNAEAEEKRCPRRLL